VCVGACARKSRIFSFVDGDIIGVEEQMKRGGGNSLFVEKHDSRDKDREVSEKL
jgi:hypothetical protein